MVWMDAEFTWLIAHIPDAPLHFYYTVLCKLLYRFIFVKVQRALLK